MDKANEFREVKELARDHTASTDCNRGLVLGADTSALAPVAHVVAVGGAEAAAGGPPGSETIQGRLQEPPELWEALQAACEVRPTGYGAGWVGSGPLPIMPMSTLPQALRLRRSVEELGSWLKPVEVELRAPISARTSLAWRSSWGPRESWRQRWTGRHRPCEARPRPRPVYRKAPTSPARDVTEQAQLPLQR